MPADDEKHKRIRESHVKVMEAAARCRELTPGLIEAANEAALYRQWMCPTHGPVGHGVNAVNECVEKVATSKKTHRIRLCGRPCERNGPLMFEPKQIIPVLGKFAQVSAMIPVVQMHEGVSKLPALTYNDNRKVEAPIPLWLYDRLTPELKAEIAARSAAPVDAPKLIEATVV